MRRVFGSERAGELGFQASPLFADFAARMDGNRPFAQSDAKRHHFIPQFLLRGFESGGKLHQLDRTTGDIHPVATEKAASRRWYYRFTNVDGDLDTSMETFLSIVESHASPAIANLRNPLLPLADSDRATLSFFFALLDARTPWARKRLEALQHDLMKFTIGTRVGTPEAFAASDPPLAGEDPEVARLRIIEDLKRGAILPNDPDSAGMKFLLETAGKVASLVYEMDWYILRPVSGQFITSDRGLAMRDENLRAPWSGNAWHSSDSAETYIPLSRDCCVLVRPGGGRTERIAVSRSDVDDVNGLIYGFADQYLYGDPAELARLQKWARANQADVPSPRPVHFVIMLMPDPDDDSIAKNHRERGWPEQVHYRDDDGRVHAMDYLVIGLDGEAVELAMGTAELVEKRHGLVDPDASAAIRRSADRASEQFETGMFR